MILRTNGVLCLVCSFFTVESLYVGFRYLKHVDLMFIQEAEKHTNIKIGGSL